MPNNNLELENLVILITDEKKDKFRRMARVVGHERSEIGEKYSVKYVDGIVEELSGDGFKVFQKFCDPKDSERLTVEGKSFVSLREEFKKLNDQKDNHLFCWEYGKLFY